MSDSAPQDRRRSARFATHLLASVRESGKARSPATILDISSHGCRIETASGLVEGSWVWLNLPSLSAQYSRVSWRCDAFAGLEFCAPLSEVVLEHLLGARRVLTKEDEARLKEASTRCRTLANRTGGAAATQLVSLATACEVTVLVEHLKGLQSSNVKLSVGHGG
jgi:hypothetical protein